MPRATKDTKKDKLEEEKKATKSKSSVKKTTKKADSETKKKSTAKKTSTEKKATSTSVGKNKKTSAKKDSKKEKTTKTKTPTKKVAEKKSTKTKKVTSTAKKETKATKSASSKKATKKSTGTETATQKKTKATSTPKKTATKKTTATQKAASKSTTAAKKTASTTKSKKLEHNIVAEYYDLPYRYNETIVKILYQTPTVLFVYWDISDYDRNNFISQYGENFFNETKPILKIFNLTKNYNFEVEINDFANSWYINVNDANCEYKVELGRKPISYNSTINTDYVYVSSSNDIEFPNDHILIDELPEYINFKNVKTGQISTRKISTLRFVGINKIYSIYDFYKVLYNENILDEFNNKKFLSSSSPSSWSN